LAKKSLPIPWLSIAYIVAFYAVLTMMANSPTPYAVGLRGGVGVAEERLSSGNGVSISRIMGLMGH
jgi:hypothetical protein